MSEDEQRVQVQIALWQMLEAEGMKPTADLVRRIRKLVEDGLKDRDVVLEEAAERAAFVAGYRAAHMVPDAYDSTSAAEEAWEGYRLISRNLKERVMVCSNQPTEDGRSPQAGRATLASHQARAGLGHAEGIPNAADRNVYRLQTSGQRLCAALNKIAVRDLPDALIQQFSGGHQEAISIARKALAHIEPEPDWAAQVDGNPKGGDAEQAPGDSLTARSRSDAPNP